MRSYVVVWNDGLEWREYARYDDEAEAEGVAVSLRKMFVDPKWVKVRQTGRIDSVMYDFSRMTTSEVRTNWYAARNEVWRREGRRLGANGFPIRDRNEDEREYVEATSDSLHPEGF